MMSVLWPHYRLLGGPVAGVQMAISVGGGPWLSLPARPALNGSSLPLGSRVGGLLPIGHMVWENTDAIVNKRWVERTLQVSVVGLTPMEWPRWEGGSLAATGCLTPAKTRPYRTCP